MPKPLEKIADEVAERLFASIEQNGIFKHHFVAEILTGLNEAVAPLQGELLRQQVGASPTVGGGVETKAVRAAGGQLGGASSKGPYPPTPSAPQTFLLTLATVGLLKLDGEHPVFNLPPHEQDRTFRDFERYIKLTLRSNGL